MVALVFGAPSSAFAVEESNGTVVTWGSNSDGQFTVPEGLTNVEVISARRYHSLALKEDGTVVAWGSNSDGQSTVPEGLSNVKAIAAGDLHSLAILDILPPKVRTATPTGPGIGRGTNVAATFSEAMDVATINGTTFKLSKAGSTNNVGAALTYNATSHKAVLDPNKRLAAGTKYKAVVTTGAEDLAGNRLDQNTTLTGNQQKTWTFTTKG